MTTLHVPAQRSAPAPASGAPAPQGSEPTRVVVDLGWTRILRVTAARAALALIVSLLVWSLLPMLAGMTPRLIVSGSMEPRIHVGDVVVTREVPAATLKEGQVLTTADPDHPDRTRTHRLERREADGSLVTKGDANPEPDSSTVTGADVLGIGILRVPFVGRPAFWVAERNWAALGATSLVLMWIGLSACAATRREEEVVEDEGDGPTTGTGFTSTRRSRRARQAAAVAAASAVAVGAAMAPAEAAFREVTVNPVSTFSAAASFGTSYQSIVTSDSPFFYWRLNEASGTTVDDTSSNGRDGALATGGSTWGQAGALGSDTANKALKVNMAALTANASTTGPAAFTVEAWIKTTSTNGGRILGFGNGSGQNASSTVDRQLYLGTNGRVYFGVGTAKTVVASTAAVNNGQWRHVVGTYTSGSNGMKLYVDGVLQGSATATPVSMTGFWRAGAEGMSGWTSNPGQFFDGTLDELAVYTRALSAAEVTEHLTAAD